MKRCIDKALLSTIISVCFALPLLLCSNVGWAAPLETGSHYHYFYGDKKIVLHSSPNLLVVDSDKSSKGLNEKALKQIGVVLDPLSKQAALRDNGLKLYRRVSQPTGVREKSLKSLVEKKFSAENVVHQPVFEQGQALLIPSAEIIVGFSSADTIARQREILSSLIKVLGISKLKELGGKSLLVTIYNPGDGRCYQVCHELAQVSGVTFAEPNHLVIMLDEHDQLELVADIKIETDPEKLTDLDVYHHESLPRQTNSGNDLQRNGWQLLAGLDAEDEKYPPPGWSLNGVRGKAATAWGRTDYRAFSGRHSIYCAGAGPHAVNAPGPVPVNMSGRLYSPTLDLSSFDEVYIEVWFYSKNEVVINQGKPELRDLPILAITDGKTAKMKYLTVIHSGGDCTNDPTTKKGWRRCLYRVPPAYRTKTARVCFYYRSDGQNPKEGCYLDDIRILGRKGRQEGSKLGNDPYGDQQYELINRGQVAGIGDQDSDMDVPAAWSLVKISPDLVVAVIDDGVELNHPDLNLTEGYRPNGTVGGGPPSENSNHGTSVAGNIGAIGNNGIGVIGVAPNVKIMPINGGNSKLARAQAIRVAVAKGAKIINNSWGWVGAPSKEIEMAVTKALESGVIVLFSGGNGPDRPPFTYNIIFPSSLTETSAVICVGATSLSDEHKSASSSDGQFGWGSSFIGAGPDICAPGPWSYTTDRLGKAGYNDGSSGVDANYHHGFSGTSSSCPKVAGVVALMLSANPQLTPKEVKSILQKSADDIEEPGYDDKTGAGRVNAYKAVQMAQAKTKTQRHQEQPANHNRQYEAFDTPGRSPNQPTPFPPASGSGWQSVVE
ncbi:MAG: S8 family serine peptidase [Pseudomonadota bacterium]|nr:S8 family serine peptidase [Pseudomonadota bacterium]